VRIRADERVADGRKKIKEKAYIINGTNLLHMELNIASEILDILLGEEIHARALAKRLEINHMTAIRNLKELVDENVLEFRKDGRNKVYLMKKSMEARNYALISELYKLNKILKKYPELRKTIKDIQQKKGIGLAVLFGSYAKGTANKNSDIDVFIETKDRGIKKELELLDSRLGVKIGEYDRSNSLIKEIEKNHVIIKGAELFYEKIGFLQ
jgi:predicted nucleotidyltransferase